MDKILGQNLVFCTMTVGGILKTRDPKVLDLRTPEELFILNNYVKRSKLSLVKTNIFRRSLQLALHKTVRPF